MYTNVPRGRNQYRGKAHKAAKFEKKNCSQRQCCQTSCD